MKKIILVLLFCLFFMSGCSKNDEIKEMEIHFIEDREHEMITDYTYKFIGESEHFYFQTGKVYYNGNERSLLISNFNIKKPMKSTNLYSVEVSFDGKGYFGRFGSEPTLTKKEYMDTVIGEYGTLGERDENGDIKGESDSFVETTKENFKDSIKVEVEYCSNNECQKEELKIKIIEEK